MQQTLESYVSVQKPGVLKHCVSRGCLIRYRSILYQPTTQKCPQCGKKLIIG